MTPPTSPLTREQIEENLKALRFIGVGTGGKKFVDEILAHDAAQRARVQALEGTGDHTVCNKSIAEWVKKASNAEEERDSYADQLESIDKWLVKHSTAIGISGRAKDVCTRLGALEAALPQAGGKDGSDV